MRVACIANRRLELGVGDPLGEEVGGHLRVGHVNERAFAVADATLERVIAAEKVPRPGGGANARAHLVVGQVVR